MKKITTRRKISAWILLGVFVPMLLLSAIHVHHHDTHHHEDECVECVKHIPHAGHISSAQGFTHTCLLCQLFSLPYLTGTAVVLFINLNLILAFKTDAAPFVCVRAKGIVNPRAPPVCLI